MMDTEGQIESQRRGIHPHLDGKHIFIFALIGVAAIAFVMSRGANKAANSTSTTPDYVNTTPLYYGDPSNGSLPGGSTSAPTNGGAPAAPGPVIPTPAPVNPTTPTKPTNPTKPPGSTYTYSPTANGTPVTSMAPGKGGTVNPVTHQINQTAAQRVAELKQLNQKPASNSGTIRSGPVDIRFQTQTGQSADWVSNSTHNGEYSASQVGYIDPTAPKPANAKTYVAGIGWF